jgi:hypothetical protein
MEESHGDGMHIKRVKGSWFCHAFPTPRSFPFNIKMAPNLEPIGYQLVVITFVFGFVALATLSVRLWFRVRQKKFDVSDSLLIAAMVR